MPKFLRPDVTDQVECAIGAAVRVTIQASHTTAWLVGTAIVGLIELLLRERCKQQPQSLDLLGIEDAVEQVEKVCNREQLSLGDIAQVWPRGQVNCRRKFGKKMFGDVEIEIEPGQVALLLLHQFLEFELRKHHSTFRM